MNRTQWQIVWREVRMNGLQNLPRLLPRNVSLYVWANKTLIKRGY